MPDLPSGTVTFLFTDIEGSTALWERDRTAMAAAVERHIALLDTAIQTHGGVHFKTVGDAVQAAFPTAPDAVGAALDAQRALVDEDWGQIGPLTVRMALHAGEAIPDERGDYLAAPLNRLARLLSAGHGGQILLSQTVQQLTRGALPPGAELRDLGEHRLRDLLEPERVFQLLDPDLPDQFPPLKSLASRPNNLPLQPTPFLGREQEVEQVVALVRRPEVRLLTLTGPGGTGKTRLALQAAAELLDDFPDGVFFVPLATLTDPDLVLATIATTLGMREEGDQPLVARFRDFLATKLLLLVLDNMEHLANAAPAVGELLSTSPGLKVLATSRMPLRLRAEREYAVPPLGLPRRKPPPTLDQLSQYEAVRLFIERAQAVKSDFTIDNESAPAVAEICWRLDGLPLAIELAAARIRMLPPQAMLARLEHRLPMLAGGARDAPERQRTLRNTVAWSYDLLEPEDQVLFRRLAAFAGGCTLEAAEAVGNHDGGLDAFGGVERLCEHSLLRQEEDPGGEPRFTMLETVREFALEQLKASGEEPAVRDAHSGAILALADLAAPHLEGGEQGLWKTRLEADVANLRAAIGWLRMQGRVSEILHLGAAVKWFWCTYHPVEAGQWLEAALADAGNVSWDVKADALHAAGHLARFRADIPRASELHGEELKLRQAAGDNAGLGRLLLTMGMEATERGDPSAATPYLQDALDRLRGANDAWAVGITLAFLGHVARLSGDLEGAARHYEEAAQTQRGIGDTYHLVLTLIDLVRVRTQQGKFEQAQELSLAALTVAEDVGLDRSRVTAFGALADIAIAATNLDAAEEYLLKALKIGQAIDEADTGDILVALGALHHRRGNDQAAFAYLQQGLELVRSAGNSSSITFCLEAIAVIAADRGMVEPAARLLGAAAAADPGAAVYRFPSEQASYERVMVLSRSMLGEAAFTTAFEAGQGLPVSAALTEMLDLTNQWAHEVVPA